MANVSGFHKMKRQEDKVSFISDGTGSRFAVERSRKKRIADVVARPGEDKATHTRSQPELPAYPQCG